MTLVRLNNRPYRFSKWIQEFENNTDPIQKTLTAQTPPVNISEDEKGYHLALLAPGRNKEAFSVSVEKDLLKIQYEIQETSLPADQKVIRNEFVLQRFSRTFTLDQNIESDSIEASYVNGILNLYLPKKKTTEPEQKRIQVQ